MDGRGLMAILTEEAFQEYIDERLADLTRVGVTATALEEETPRWVYCLEELRSDTKKAAKAKRRREAAERAEAERRQKIEDEKRRALLKEKLQDAQATVTQHAPALTGFLGAGAKVAKRRAEAEEKARKLREAEAAAALALAAAPAPAPAAHAAGDDEARLALPPVVGASPRSPEGPPAPPEGVGEPPG